MCGVYQTEDGKPYVLPSVKQVQGMALLVSATVDSQKARTMLFDNPAWEHEYPSSHLGEAPFRDLSARLLFGDDSPIVQEKRLASFATR